MQSPGYGDHFSDLEAQGGKRVVSQWEASVKAGFIKKVYAILSIQLLATVATGAFFMFHEETRNFVLSTPSLLYMALFLPFGFLIGLYCCKNQHPLNLCLLGGFTLSLAYSVGCVCARYYAVGYGMIVFQALLLTAAVFISLTTYVFVTKKDFSFLGAGLYAALMILIVWSLINMIFPIDGGFRIVFSAVGALIFAGYILYDTSLIVHNYGPDDYIEASINLYLDIINLFLYLLEILRMLQGESD